MSTFRALWASVVTRAFTYVVATFIIAVTISACGDGGESNSPVELGQYDWVALEHLLPTPFPENERCSLLAGKFSSAEGAEALRSRAQSSGLSSSIIPVVDNGGYHWFIVSAGNFPSSDAARAARASIGMQLGINEQLPLILLPPEK